MNERKPEFSIIVPVYNRKAFLEAALLSISKQTCQSYEIIVIDDGSTDETAEYVDFLGEHLGEQVLTICQPNSGVSVARNCGAKIATGNYLVFLDSDDVLLPWSLQCYSDVINRFLPSVISALPIEFENGLPVVQYNEYEKPVVTMFDDYLAAAKYHSFVGASCIIIECNAFARSGGFLRDMNAAEDYDLLLRIGLERPYVKIERPVTIGYRVHADNISRRLDWKVRGSITLLAREFEGAYPGGSNRVSDRITIIGRVVRPVILASLKRKRLKDAWHLYRKSFWMHVRLLRLRFLLGFVLLFISQLFRTCDKAGK